MNSLTKLPSLLNEKLAVSSEEAFDGASITIITTELHSTGWPCPSLFPLETLFGCATTPKMTGLIDKTALDRILEPLPPWLTALYDQPDQPLSALSPLIQTLFCQINECLREENWKDVDRLLRFCDFQRLPTAGKVGLLRITFAARQHLKSWRSAFHRVTSSLQAGGKDVASLLQGLSSE